MTDFKLPTWYQLAHKIPEKFNHHLLQAGMNQLQDVTDREQSLTRPHNALHDLVWDLFPKSSLMPPSPHMTENRALLSVAQMHHVCSDHRAFAHERNALNPIRLATSHSSAQSSSLRKPSMISPPQALTAPCTCLQSS